MNNNIYFISFFILSLCWGLYIHADDTFPLTEEHISAQDTIVKSDEIESPADNDAKDLINQINGINPDDWARSWEELKKIKDSELYRNLPSNQKKDIDKKWKDKYTSVINKANHDLDSIITGIRSIPPVVFSDHCEDKIKEVKDLIDALKPEEEFFFKEVYLTYNKKFCDYERKYNDLLQEAQNEAKNVENSIAKIGIVDDSNDCETRIKSARKAYDGLGSEKKKSLVSNRKELESKEEQLNILKEKNNQQQLNDARQEKEDAILRAEDAEQKVKIISFVLIILAFCVIISITIGVIVRRRHKKNMDKKGIVSKDKKKEDIVIPPPTAQSPSSNGKTDSNRESSQSTPPTDAVTPSSSTVPTAKWVIVGASVKGNGHIQSNMPCQDNNMFESFGNGWGIAIVSDGAGSAAHSEFGSKIVVSRGIFHFKNLIEKERWIEKKALPSDIEWLQKSYSVLKDLRNDVIMVAQKNNIDVKSLSATCLIVIYSPFGLLTVHIGDGRMGYKSMSGEWKSMMTPHKGDEANQTIFLVSEFWSIPNYEMSGVLVPECRVVRENVKAFALMSDGCENTAWLCSALNSDTGKYSDRNLPFDGFFNPLEETLLTFDKDNVPEEERQAKWYKFIESGASGFAKEQDDKTMIYALNVELVK